MSKTDADSDNVRVAVRCRPLNEKEKSQGHRMTVKIDELRGSVEIANPQGSDQDPPKIFNFDIVFGPDSKQVDVYTKVARPIVESVLEGYNGTVFAYGQTGTGKTFTMEGVRTVPELRGIIPNSFAHIFGKIAKAEKNQQFLVRVSYLEIYNEDVRDLLGQDQNKRLEVKERPDTGVYVKDLNTVVVHTADDMDKLMTIGNKNRSVGATNMNEQSSRSHATFTATVECSETVNGKTMFKQGKLHLVDLAGSERQSKTGATGQRLKEATKINLSLSTLGNVISALVDGKSTHIPYRNSKLTRLLQDSLGGNSKTVMVANFGPANYNYDETVSTLRYANRAKNIKNSAKINEDPKDALLRQFQAEIERLRRQLEEGGIDDEEGDEEDDDDDVILDGDGQRIRKKRPRRRSGAGLSKERMAEIQRIIEADRRKLENDKDMEEEERNKVQAEVQAKEAELKAALDDQEELQKKLANMEKKIIVGGKNLLETAEHQEKLLEESAAELEQVKRREEEMRRQLEEREAVRLDIEEKYNSLQEEVAGKTKKLRKLWNIYMQTKSELTDMQQEHQREMEGLLENVRQLSRELRLNMLLIDQCIPREYQDLIEQNVQWNEDIGEWQLRCVAYTGNNMRKQASEAEERERRETMSKFAEPDLGTIYLSYSEEGEREIFRPSGTERNGQSSANAKKQRPKSSRAKTAKRRTRPQPTVDSVLK